MLSSLVKNLFNNIDTDMEFEKFKKETNSQSCIAVDSLNDVSKSRVFKMDEYIINLGNEYKCDACNVYMKNISIVESHARGQKHLKTISNFSRHADPLFIEIAQDIKTALTPSNTACIFDCNTHTLLEEVVKDIKVVNVNDPIIS